VTVAIVTDSAAALPAGLVTRHRITVVPMWLTIGGESVREGERPLTELLGDERVSTSGPAPGEFEEAMESRLGDDGVLVLTIAASMSGTHESAAVAAGQLGDRVGVVDTATAAGAEALVVLAAAAAAEQGASLDEVEAEAKDVVERVQLVAQPLRDAAMRLERVVPGPAHHPQLHALAVARPGTARHMGRGSGLPRQRHLHFRRRSRAPSRRRLRAVGPLAAGQRRQHERLVPVRRAHRGGGRRRRPLLRPAA